MNAPRRSALILSTTPPIPRDYGNRNRVFQTMSFFRDIGYDISFLLYPLDREWAEGIPAYHAELCGMFDYFAIIPNSRPLHRLAAGEHHLIDEWWDDAIGLHLDWLFRRRRFDVFLANYTFLSKAFEHAPKQTVKILDTHDLFSLRRELFGKHGVSPEFFYTTPEEEKTGFDRSDIVIAIKASEAVTIRSMTRKFVACLPYWDDRAAPAREDRPMAAEAFTHDRPLRLGFIGAHNSVNIVNIRRFLVICANFVKLYNLPLEVVIAGNCCDSIAETYSFVTKLGFVDDIEEFYAGVDAIVAPLEFSTGIKIKVGEALARGIPVLSTRNGFDGFRCYHVSQDAADLPQLCELIARVAYGEIATAELAMATRKTAATAARAQAAGFAELREAIVAASPRILLFTDRPFWYRATFIDELIAQSIEFLAHLAPVIVCYTCAEAAVPERIFTRAEYVQVEALGPDIVTELAQHYRLIAAVAIGADIQREIAALLDGTGLSAWVLSIDHPGGGGAAFRELGSGGGPIALSPLRYAPGGRPLRLRERSHVSLFAPAAPDEWSRLVCDYVESGAAEARLPVRRIEVPAYQEFEPAFYREVLDAMSATCVIVCRHSLAPEFLLQLSALDQGRCLVIHPDFICPEQPDHQGRPSLQGSISRFLAGDASARVRANADSGWSRVWGALEPAVGFQPRDVGDRHG